MYSELCAVAPELEIAPRRLALLRELLCEPVAPSAVFDENRPALSFEDQVSPTPRPELVQQEPSLGRRRSSVTTQRNLASPLAVMQLSDQSAIEDDIDPLGDTQQLHLSELQPPKRDNALAKTMPSISPMVLPSDEGGCSVVELPATVTNVFEKSPLRPSSVEAAEIAEPLGVIVRPVVMIRT
jgi:hypothetical protein